MTAPCLQFQEGPRTSQDITIAEREEEVGSDDGQDEGELPATLSEAHDMSDGMDDILEALTLALVDLERTGHQVGETAGDDVGAACLREQSDIDGQPYRTVAYLGITVDERPSFPSRLVDLTVESLIGGNAEAEEDTALVDGELFRGEDEGAGDDRRGGECRRGRLSVFHVRRLMEVSRDEKEDRHDGGIALGQSLVPAEDISGGVPLAVVTGAEIGREILRYMVVQDLTGPFEQYLLFRLLVVLLREVAIVPGQVDHLHQSRVGVLPIEGVVVSLLEEPMYITDKHAPKRLGGEWVM